MKKEYIEYSEEEVTKEVLDSIKVGDLIKVNNWKKPLRVKAVSNNYFVMAAKVFGKWEYSVCEKKPWGGIRHNDMTRGMFHVGVDAWIFGAPTWLKFGSGDGAYRFDDQGATQAYLNTFELPENAENHSFISPRGAKPIRKLFVKFF